MSFRLSQDQVIKLASLGDPTFTDARFAWIIWETDKTIIQNLLPPGLSMVDPYAFAYVADFPKTNFSPPYKESALFVAVVSETEKKGIYCLAMPVTNEVALFAGRQVGYPKKIANINYQVNGSHIQGSVERYDKVFVEITLHTDKVLSIAQDDKVLEYLSPKGALVFNVINVYTESFVTAEMKAYIVRQRIRSKPDESIICQGDIHIYPSIYDPWAEVPIKKILFGMAFKGQTKMLEVNLDHPVEAIKSMPVNFARMNDLHHFL